MYSSSNSNNTAQFNPNNNKNLINNNQSVQTVGQNNWSNEINNINRINSPTSASNTSRHLEIHTNKTNFNKGISIGLPWTSSIVSSNPLASESNYQSNNTSCSSNQNQVTVSKYSPNIEHSIRITSPSAGFNRSIASPISESNNSCPILYQN